MGCRAIHIGGGEPFLKVDRLRRVVEIARFNAVHVEYVETNSSWYQDKDSTEQILSALKDAGLSTLLISMSPFHNEYIPFYKVKGVMEACDNVGLSVFPWILEFYDEIDALGDQGTHTIEEYQARYGQNYLRRLPSRYWVHLGGRALKTFSPVLAVQSVEGVLSSNRRGCDELLDVSHFHFDLFGNYIPGLCSGLAIHRDDLGKEISQGEYPYLHALFHTGITGLFERVSRQCRFEPADNYLSKCHLCFDLRRHLVLGEGVESKEFVPRAFYKNV
jgi:hypothetical protein